MDKLINRIFAMQKVFPLVKADEATHTVYGLVTASTPDKEGEICNYEAAKKAYKAWSKEAKDATSKSGQEVSLGNIRVQHTEEVGGKVTKLEFDDEAQEIYVASTTIDDEMWTAIAGGFYTGYSQGGDYSWRICQDCGETVPKNKGNFCANCKKVVGIEYGPTIAEVSYVDNPCHGSAHFDLVKADGTHQMVKFQRSTTMEQEGQSTALDQATLDRIDAVVKSAVSDALKPASVTEPVTKGKALSTVTSRVAATKLKKSAATVEEKTERFKKLVNSFVEQEVRKRLPSNLQKDMYAVSRFAGLINEISYLVWSTQYEAEIEQDNSTLPDALQEDLENLVESFLAMAEEETSELTAATAERIGKVMKVTQTGLNKAYNKAAGIVNKIKKAVDDHHEATTTANEEHAEKVKGHLEELKDAMSGKSEKSAPAPVKKGTPHQETDAEIDDQEEGELEECDPEEEGTKNIAQKSYSAADVQEIVNSTVQKVIKALTKSDDEDEEEQPAAVAKAKKKPAAAADDEEEEDEEEAPKAKKVAAGIGSRGSMTRSNGPVIKTMPVHKESDGLPTMVKTISATEVDEAVVKKALQKGDVASQLALMKSARPQNEVPSTLAAAVGGLSKGRR